MGVRKEGPHEGDGREVRGCKCGDLQNVSFNVVFAYRSLLREEFEGEMGIIRGSMKGGGTGGRSLRRPFHRTERRRLNHPMRAISGYNNEQETRERDNDRRNKLNFLDSGAGPREVRLCGERSKESCN